MLRHNDSGILFCESFQILHLLIDGAFQVQVHAEVIVSARVSQEL